MSIWKFMNKAHLTIQVQQAFMPKPPQQHDISIMDFFVQQNTHCSDLRVINRCRIYLQVLFLSDICSADGKSILSECCRGQRPLDRHSSLNWPIQPRPPNSAWKTWQTALATLHTNGTLHTPLGAWASPTHQEWFSYLCPHSRNILR